MSKKTQIYQQLASELHMRYDYGHSVIFGTWNGFEVILHPADARYPFMLTASISARNPDSVMFTKDELTQFCKDNKPVNFLRHNGNIIAMGFKNNPNPQKLQEAVSSSLNALTNMLQSRGYSPCCQLCGQYTATSNYIANSQYLQVCSDCAGKIHQDMSMAVHANQNKSENILGGIVGALIGSVIGVICIIIFGQLGRVAAISGIVMAICTLKGYELLGGKLTKKGIVIGCIVMIVMTYVGNRMDLAILVVRELNQYIDVDFFSAFRAVPELVKQNYIDQGAYMSNLVLLYIFTVVGIVPTIISVVKNRKNEGKIEQIG